MNKIVKVKIVPLLVAICIGITSVGCRNTSIQSGASGTVSLTEEKSSENISETNSTITPVVANNLSKSGVDTYASWNEQDVTAVITLSDTAIQVDGSGAIAVGSILTINKGGLYVISGNLSDGQILIHAPSTDTVQIVLQGVDISSSTSAAIYESQADKLILILDEGSENKIADATNYTYADAVAEEPDAAIFAKHDLTITGTGALSVTGNYNNGIGTKDDLLITSGNITVTAKNHGLRGRDSLSVEDGNFVINAGSDGIQSNNDEDSSKGWISLSGGTYAITAASDGIQAETSLSISGGTYNMITGGGNTSSGGTTTNSSDSYKGIKGGTAITVTGGTFVVDSADDTVHSNGSITISGGTFTLSSGDDGIHADGDLTISNGKVDILTAYEGLEASTMTLSGGDISIVSTDDGINIAGGNDGSTGRFGADQFTGNSTYWLLISGGNILVKAGSDAIDSNGDATMTGGTVDLTAAMLGEGQTLDTDGTWSQPGGELTESGGGGMGGMGGMGGRGGGGTKPSR